MNYCVNAFPQQEADLKIVVNALKHKGASKNPKHLLKNELKESLQNETFLTDLF